MVWAIIGGSVGLAMGAAATPPAPGQSGWRSMPERVATSLGVGRRPPRRRSRPVSYLGLVVAAVMSVVAVALLLDGRWAFGAALLVVIILSVNLNVRELRQPPADRTVVP